MSMPAAAVWTLGAVQCVYWGVLYYSFSVLLVSMRAEFGIDHAALAGAFSAGLAVSAALATAVGRRLDRGQGIVLLRAGGLATAALLWTWSLVTSVAALYLVWIGLGACMALVLYETAFALVTQAVVESGARLRALASVTVLGGLASTIFLPLAGLGVEQLGWRTTLRGLVLAWLFAAWLLERHALPGLRAGARLVPDAPPAPVQALPPRSMWTLALPFVAATFSALAVTTLVIPMLVDLGHPLALAAWVLAAFGLMQLPGRIWLWRGGGALLSARGLLVAPLVLQAAGLALLATRSLAAAIAGVAVFGIGSGLHTLARPWVVPQLVGVARAGRVNGAIARAQGLARAAGPFIAAALYGRVGSTPVFLGLALVLVALCPWAVSTATRVQVQQPAAAKPCLV